HDVWPWASYFLGCVGDAYERFADRIAAGTNGRTKQDRIRDFVLLHAPAGFSISDIRRAVPGVSDQTIRLVLTELKAAGKVTVDGSGRGATWQRR
ncbi:MAG: filamentation induced by cAMP protein Fic, partial [Ilumatobacteraceae bacterium]|nr:filamentation induced by cAMP protein Fic [Ilumatobacteraceae bacterium]